jgi:DNA-binding MarR family transcriptional regulator
MNLVLQVRPATQALGKKGRRLFQVHGLTPAQFDVLHLLSDQPAGMCASALARQLVAAPADVTGLLQRMKLAGLLLEFEPSADHRQHVVGLSPKGRAAWKAAHCDYEKDPSALTDYQTSNVER